MADKIKLITLSDHPLIPSGVAIQTRYILEGLLKTGDYTIHSLGAAQHHEEKRPVRVDEYGDDWVIWPTIGYGDMPTLRAAFDAHNYDALWFMTDPRFYTWLFEGMDEIKERGAAVLYNHVWDEMPIPIYNKPFYVTCDYIGCISKLTHEIIKGVGLGDRSEYIPHAVDANIFKPLGLRAGERKALRSKIVGAQNADKFILFFNSRNARRKMTGDILFAFKAFIEKIGRGKALLFMHTDPNDSEGPNLHSICNLLDLNANDVLFSTQPQQPQTMAQFYNISDCLINISNNEGFGLSCLEALSCGKLAVVNMTGGLQDQIKDPDSGIFYGVGIEPAAKNIAGSQQIPFIYDCRVAEKDVVDALHKVYSMSPEKRDELGKKAREHTLRNFSMDNMVTKWDKAIKHYVGLNRSAGTEVKVSNL